MQTISKHISEKKHIHKLLTAGLICIKISILTLLCSTIIGCSYFLNTAKPPTDITLSNTTVAEGQNGANVGTLNTIDPNSTDTFYYNISGTDADYFELNGTTLKLKPTIRLTKSEKSYLTIQIKVTDSGGKTLTKTFTITVVTASS